MIVKLCAVASCSKPQRTEKSATGRSYHSSRYCVGHQRRRVRLGDPRAKRCRKCRRVVIDEHDETHLLGPAGMGGSYVCRRCLERRAG